MTSRLHNQCNAKTKIPQLRDLRAVIKLSRDWFPGISDESIITFLSDRVLSIPEKRSALPRSMGIKDCRTFSELSQLSGARLRVLRGGRATLEKALLKRLSRHGTFCSPSLSLFPSHMRALFKGGVMKLGTGSVLIDEETITACCANKTLRQS